MKRIYSPNGKESRIIHNVDWAGYHGLGWLEEKPVDPPEQVELEPVFEDEDQTIIADAITAELIGSLSWRDQKAMLSPEQQANKPTDLSWEDWAISLLVEVPTDE